MSKKASKKRESGAKQPGPDATPPPMPARAGMEKMMADIGRLLEEQEFDSIDEANAFLEEFVNTGQPFELEKRNLTPVDQAQDLMYDAWDATGAERVQLAQGALEISEDCADAYVLLAEETAQTLKDAMRMYELGVEAGERALGPEAFEEFAGHFWGVLETRPYMRARFGLAGCLWGLGERQAAIEHLTDMLRLNPGDNQGLRYELSNWLLAEERHEELGNLLDQYAEDISAVWAYNRALYVFRQEGAGRKANACLKEAIEINSFVPAYLLSQKKLPEWLPEYIGFGDENEAISYAVDGAILWVTTEGAIEWLVSRLS